MSWASARVYYPHREMTELESIIHREIERTGILPFTRFMQLALYHPEFGYYRRPRDPFGREGDFYTAQQLQPLFGDVIGGIIEQWDAGPAVVELGAGRGEMATAFSRWDHVAIEAGRGDLPAHFEGVVFANEFFDALPV